jgi:hypothetical protein
MSSLPSLSALDAATQTFPVLSTTHINRFYVRTADCEKFRRAMFCFDPATGGDSHLERVGWTDKLSGETTTHQVRHVFIE